MAIAKTTDTDEELALKITNGDLKAIKEVQKKWKFKNIEDIIPFALAILVKADNNKVYIDQNGTKLGFSPADNLIDKETTTTTTTSSTE